jgi:hypothetical protein
MTERLWLVNIPLDIGKARWFWGANARHRRCVGSLADVRLPGSRQNAWAPNFRSRGTRIGETTAVISDAQVRAARAMVGWTAVALAKKAVVPIFTLEWIEGDGKITSSDRKALAAIQSELEAAGIEFLSGDAPSVRLHPKGRK